MKSETNCGKHRSNIKYLVTRNNNYVSFTIYDMNEAFRNCREPFKTSNGMVIETCNFPEIFNSLNKIYLRGEDIEKDYRISVCSFKNSEEAKEYVKKLHDALKDWSENWEGFRKANMNNSMCEFVEI